MMGVETPALTRGHSTRIDEPRATVSRMTTVRVAGVADADVVGGLLSDFNEEFETAGPTAEEFARRFRRLLGLPEVLVLLADGEDGAEGFALATYRPSPYYDGPLGYLDELYVRPPMRGRGIGGALLGALLEDAGRRGAGELHIGVDEIDDGARRFYERHGFSNLETGADYRMLLYIREL